MGIDEVVLIHAFEGGVGIGLFTEFDVEVGGGSAGLFVALSGDGELGADFHTGADEDLLNTAFLSNSTPVKPDNLPLIVNIFPSSTVEVLQRAHQSNVDIGHRLGQDFIEAAEGSAEIGAFDLSSFGVDDLGEGVLLEEEFLENLIAVLLVDIATSADAIGSENAGMEHFFAILFIDSPQLF